MFFVYICDLFCCIPECLLKLLILIFLGTFSPRENLPGYALSWRKLTLGIFFTGYVCSWVRFHQQSKCMCKWWWWKKLRKSSQQGRAHIVKSHVVLRYSNNAIMVIVKKFCQKLWSEQIFLCYHLQCTCTICRKLHELNRLFS